jgi:hypothetical protein
MPLLSSQVPIGLPPHGGPVRDEVSIDGKACLSFDQAR